MDLKDYIKIYPAKINKIKVVGPMSTKLENLGGESLLMDTLNACHLNNLTKQKYLLGHQDYFVL